MATVVSPDHESDQSFQSVMRVDSPVEHLEEVLLVELENHDNEEKVTVTGSIATTKPKCKRTTPERLVALAKHEEGKEPSREDNNGDEIIAITAGFKIRKEFDGEFFTGTVVGKSGILSDGTKVWKVRYEDNDGEDMTEEELMTFAVNSYQTDGKKRKLTAPPFLKRVENKETAKKDLCYRIGITEEEVDAVLEKMEPPICLNTAIANIHAEKDRKKDTDPVEPRARFVPRMGMKIRKMFDGSVYSGEITSEKRMIEVGKELVPMWEVTYDDDGDKEDMDVPPLGAGGAP